MEWRARSVKHNCSPLIGWSNDMISEYCLSIVFSYYRCVSRKSIYDTAYDVTISAGSTASRNLSEHFVNKNKIRVGFRHATKA